MTSRARRTLALALASIAVLATAACRPEVVVRLLTRVYADGALERRLEVRGRPADAAEEMGPDWLDREVGIRLAEPRRWDRVEAGPDRLLASAFHPPGTELGPLLLYETSRGERQGRARTELEIEDLVVLRRFRYRESHGDPFGPLETEQALDALVRIAADALRRELARELGDEQDLAPVERWLHAAARPLLAGLLRDAADPAATREGTARWARTLTELGVPVVSADTDSEFWDAETPALLGWSRRQLAEALSTPGRRVGADDLGFWPAGEDWREELTELVERNWGSEAELWAKIEPHLAALGGYFGSGAAPRVRFEVRVDLPGSLLRTNGAPDGEAAVWLVRGDDLRQREATLEAQSVEVLREPLTRLGARREFDREQLVGLADLLGERDPDGALRRELAAAVRQGSLAGLRDPALADELEPLARELADRLDPDVPLPPPL